MSKLSYKVVLVSLLPLFFHVGYAQTCKTDSIPDISSGGRFTDNNDGTVVDNRTGLMWKKCAEGQSLLSCSGKVESFDWLTALNRVEIINSGSIEDNLGFADWRIPNIKELASITEMQCYDPAINVDIFPNTPSSWSWSSSIYNNVYNRALYVDFKYGSVHEYVKNGEGFNLNDDSMGFIRLVRGIPWE